MKASRIAKRYARALLDIGREDGNYEEYGHELKGFADLCVSNPDLFDFLSSPVFAVEEKVKVLDNILEKLEYSQTVNNFLRLLVERKRIDSISEISGYYSMLLDEVLGIARAKIITARPIKKKTLDRLIKSLEKFTSKKIEPETEIDKSIIGGVIVKIGDLILDGSVTAQLEGLKESLKRGEYR